MGSVEQSHREFGMKRSSKQIKLRNKFERNLKRNKHSASLLSDYDSNYVQTILNVSIYIFLLSVESICCATFMLA